MEMEATALRSNKSVALRRRLLATGYLGATTHMLQCVYVVFRDIRMTCLREFGRAVTEHNVLPTTPVVDTIDSQYFFAQPQLEWSGEVPWQVLRQWIHIRHQDISARESLARALVAPYTEAVGDKVPVGEVAVLSHIQRL
jgi:hypothetical protein